MSNTVFNVYLASKFEEAARLRQIRDERLAPMGINVTSRWLELAERADVQRGDWETRRRKHQAACIDLEDIDASDAVVLDLTFDPTEYRTYGAIFEAGYCCCAGLPLILIGDSGSIFWELPFVYRVADWDAAIQRLQQWQSEGGPLRTIEDDVELCPILTDH